jgi:hypothetical protein
VRVRAVAAIEGTDKGGVVVNVNTQTNVATITPGYVIRLPAGAPMPAIGQTDPLTIEQEREQLTIDQG